MIGILHAKAVCRAWAVLICLCLGCLLMEPAFAADPGADIRIMREAHDRGDANASFVLGVIYFDGKHAQQDFAAAARYFTAAAENGHARAMHRLGNLYSDGKGVLRNPTTAAEWWGKAAELGEGSAQYNLATAYEAGRGVKKDNLRAAYWYEKSATQDFYWPMYRLARLLETGDGVPKDTTQALRWYHAATKHKYNEALFRLGSIYAEGRIVPRDAHIALQFFRRAEQENHKGAAVEIAKLGIKEAGTPDFYLRADKIGLKSVYKGKAIYAASGSREDNDAFLRLAHYGIDLLEELPEHIRWRANLIDRIDFVPKAFKGEGSGSLNNAIGIYSFQDFRKTGSIGIHHDLLSLGYQPQLLFASSIKITLAVLANGFTAEDHRRLLSIQEETAALKAKSVDASDSEFRKLIEEGQRITARFNKSDQRAQREQRCRVNTFAAEALRILEPGIFKDVNVETEECTLLTERTSNSRKLELDVDFDFDRSGNKQAK